MKIGVLSVVFGGLALFGKAFAAPSAASRTDDNVILCRCETNFETLYSRRLSEGSRSPYGIDYSDAHLDSNGFFVIEGLRVLPKSSTSCSMGYASDDSISSGKGSGNYASYQVFMCPTDEPQTPAPQPQEPISTPEPTSMPTQLNRAGVDLSVCESYGVYGDCDRSSGSGLADTCIDHTCSAFSEPPFSMSTIGGFYNWTGGLPPQPLLLRHSSGYLVAEALISPDCSLCMIKTGEGLRVKSSHCHIAPNFPVDETGTLTKDPRFFKNEGCKASETPSQCILMAFAEIETEVCETMAPTVSPTKSPSASPTKQPSSAPVEPIVTPAPSQFPTTSPTAQPSSSPTSSPTDPPTEMPTSSPTDFPSKSPTLAPTDKPTSSPSRQPTTSPTQFPTDLPSSRPSRICGDNSPLDTVTIGGVEQSCAYVEENGATCMEIDQSSGSLVRDVCERECHNCAATCDNLVDDTVGISHDGSVVTQTCAYVAANPGVCTELDRRSPRAELVEDTCQKECLPAICPETCDNLPTATVTITETTGSSPTMRTCSYVRENKEICSLVDESRSGRALVQSVCSVECLSACTESPSSAPSAVPSSDPSSEPSSTPSTTPSSAPSSAPSAMPSDMPSDLPSAMPSAKPSNMPSLAPSGQPSSAPSSKPSAEPSSMPSATPSEAPSSTPSSQPSSLPSSSPSTKPSEMPTISPTSSPTGLPTPSPVLPITGSPTASPSATPTKSPTGTPTTMPSRNCIDNSPDDVVTIDGVEQTCEWVGQNRASCIETNQATGDLVRDLCQQECQNCAATCSNEATETVTVAEFGMTSPVTKTCAEVGANPQLCSESDLSGGENDLVEDTCQKECYFFCPVSCDNGATYTVTVNTFGMMGPQSVTCEEVLTDISLCLATDESRGGPVSSTCERECLQACVTGAPTSSPTSSPTAAPTKSPTASPTDSPTSSPTGLPTPSPVLPITGSPTFSPTEKPTVAPTKLPTSNPTNIPTMSPTLPPTASPTESPTESPSSTPTQSPSSSPTTSPSSSPTKTPTGQPTSSPTAGPTGAPTETPTESPTKPPTGSPTEEPTQNPTGTPTSSPVERIVTVCDNGPDVAVKFPGFDGSIEERECSYVGMHPEFCNEYDYSRPASFVKATCQRECLPDCPVHCANLPNYMVQIDLSTRVSCSSISSSSLCESSDEARPGGLVSNTCQRQCVDECATVAPTSSPVMSIETPSPTILRGGKGKGKGKGIFTPSPTPGDGKRGSGKRKMGASGKRSSSDSSSSSLDALPAFTGKGKGKGERRYWW